MSILSRLEAYELGELDTLAVIHLFQELVNTGLAWQLQGHYGRVAVAMLSDGVIRLPNGGQS